MGSTARLERALEHAEAAGDVEGWMTAWLALASHGRRYDARAKWDPVDERIDALRNTYRSRVGRFWAGQTLEQLSDRRVSGALGAGVSPERAFRYMESL